VTISKVYAVMSTAEIGRAHEWYARLFGRASDHHPMAGLYEWRFPNGGVQLVADAARAGRSLLTVVVGGLDDAHHEMQTRDLVLAPATGGDFAAVAQIADPDGNRITFAEPRTSPH
jgi:predicted enzyme related to lactoylglutathione lyase